MKGSIASAEEKKLAKEYYDGLFADVSNLPFSFNYGGTQYHGFDENFTIIRENGKITAHHNDGLVVTIISDRKDEYAQYEWTVYFKNSSNSDSKILKDVFGADFTVKGANPELSYSIGDRTFDTYSCAQIETPLRPGTRISLFPVYGKSTGYQRPCYRLTYGENGLIIALGWHGRWKADFFSDDADHSVRFRASQFEFCSYLKPGEEIRTPLISLIKYNGRDKYHAINMWRRWYYDCAFYRFNGEIMKPKKILGGYISTSVEINEDIFLQLIDSCNKKLDKGIDLFWIDAGWYYKYGKTSLDKSAYWSNTGTWRIDESRFPSKLKRVTDKLKEQGAIALLWFEPERVRNGSELYEKDEFCLTDKNQSLNKLADMGNPEFRSWAVDTVDNIMKESGVAIYRQDFNIDPYTFWIQADEKQGENRIGITENHYVMGILEYYKEIHKRHPEYPIDMCASGGMRNDLDVMKDCVMLTLTDFPSDNLNQMQNMRLGLFEWYSNFGGGTVKTDTYSVQSNIAPYFGIHPGINYILEKPFDELNAQYAIWEQVNNLMFCDYYPLTERSRNNDVWIAWQFYDTEYKAGFAQFFRRADSLESERVFKLHGLNPDEKYILRELNTNDSFIATGNELMTEGITVVLNTKPSCAIWKIEQQ